MKTRHFHFVCFLLLLATLGAGEPVTCAASLLTQAGQVSGALSATPPALQIQAQRSVRTMQPVTRALQSAPLAALRSVWSMRPPAAHASALQAMTALPAPAASRA